MEAPYSDELLVDMVRARENLFDKGRVDYKDEQARAESWAAIAGCFGMRGESISKRRPPKSRSRLALADSSGSPLSPFVTSVQIR